MKTKNTEEYRNNITLHLTRISGDVEHIKQDIKYVVEHLEKINGRLRVAENNITAHKAVGITMVTVLTLAISLVGLIR